MAKIRSLAVGKASGSMGNLTYKTVRGATIASEKIVENKSKSPAQVAQRAKFSVLAELFKQNQFAFKFDFPRTNRGSAWNNLVKLMAEPMFNFLDSNPSLVSDAAAGKQKEVAAKIIKNYDAAVAGVVGLSPKFSTYGIGEQNLLLVLDNDSGVNSPTFSVGPDLVGKRLYYTIVRYFSVTPNDTEYPAYPMSSFTSDYVDLVATGNTFDTAPLTTMEFEYMVLGDVKSGFGLISCYYEEDGVRKYVGTSYYGRVRV